MTEDSFAWRNATIAIIGLGLMGGSLALALREKKLGARIIAIERDAATRAKALARGAVDEASDNLARIAGADVIVLAIPPRAIPELLAQVGAHARAGAIVCDLGSTKRAIVEAMEKLPARIQAIGAHPMCGKEHAGFDAADAHLFAGSPFVLTPLARTSSHTLALMQALVQEIGARVILLDAERHDKIVAAISHLPFAVAWALMTTASERARVDDAVFALAASGFRDTSRLAASNPTMICDILLMNRDNVTACLRDYARNLNVLADAIERGDESELETLTQSVAEQRRVMFQNPKSEIENPK